MTYRQPPANKSSVRRAGKAISDKVETENDIALLDQWRMAHGYVLNTFKVWIRHKISAVNFDVEFAQRLKRRNTVVDKLRRHDVGGRPLIRDVTAMHDFAGCRLIFDSVDDLNKFREFMHSSRVMKNVNHKLKHDPQKYDYIANPKFTGYRGVHDVFRHFPRGSERGEAAKAWDGLMVEIQYRTRAQHAWATAVEISDAIDGQRTKFEMDQSERGRFFAIASELIARHHEGLAQGLSEEATSDLVLELKKLEDRLGILENLSVLRQAEVQGDFKRHNVLNIVRVQGDEIALELYTFDSPTDAMVKATELEASEHSINAVYVRGDNPKQIRSAYRNYFNDPVDFVALVRQALAA